MTTPRSANLDEAAATAAFFLPADELPRLLAALRGGGRQLVGPTVRDGAIVLAEIESADELPRGWTVEAGPGRARLTPTGGTRVFDQPPGPTSWKRWTFPPRVTQLEWPADAGEAPPRAGEPAVAASAFLGVRACEIAALAVQDRVLREGPVADADYVARRRHNLVVAVECAVAGGTCFCTSMGTGPELSGGFDIALAELD
ncbi:MAG TPA: hypothetical protein VH741_10045, partial [Candidatus Limnocylindrales bacterium]